MKLRFVVFFLILIVVSCSKDKFSDKPTLKLSQVSGNYVPIGDENIIQFTLDYTDAQGDIAGVPVIIEKLSSSAPCTDGSRDPTFTDSTSFLIPSDVPPSSNQKGEIVVTLHWTSLKPIACNPSDTLEEATFKFWLRDLAGNMSDTVTSPVIHIGKQF